MGLMSIERNFINNKALNIIDDIILFGYLSYQVVKSISVYALLMLNYKFPLLKIDVSGTMNWFFGEGKGFLDKFTLIIAFFAAWHKIFTWLYPIVKRLIKGLRKK